MSAAQCGDKETHAINILSSLELADGQDMDVRWRILESPSPLPPQAPVKSSTKARAPVFRRVISSPLPALDLTGMEGPSEKRAVAAAPVTERSAQQTSPQRYWFKQTLDLPGEMGLERLNIQRDGRCLQEDRQNSELGAIDNNDKVISQLLQSWRGGRRESYTTPGSKHSRVASSSVQDNSSLFAKHVGKHTRWDSNDRRDAAFWKALAHADAPRGRVATSCNRLDERQSCLPTIESISNLKMFPWSPPLARDTSPTAPRGKTGLKAGCVRSKNAKPKRKDNEFGADDKASAQANLLVGRERRGLRTMMKHAQKRSSEREMGRDLLRLGVPYRAA